MPADLPAEGSVDQSLADGDEKKKQQQRRGRKKSKLEDMFPAYLQVGLRLQGVKGLSVLQGLKKPVFPCLLLQEAFFGKELLDLSRKALFAVGVGRPSFALGTPKAKGDGGSDRKELPTSQKGDDGPDVADEESRVPEGKADTPGEGCRGDCVLAWFCLCQPILPLSTIRAGGWYFRTGLG